MLIKIFRYYIYIEYYLTRDANRYTIAAIYKLNCAFKIRMSIHETIGIRGMQK